MCYSRFSAVVFVCVYGEVLIPLQIFFSPLLASKLLHAFLNFLSLLVFLSLFYDNLSLFLLVFLVLQQYFLHETRMRSNMCQCLAESASICICS